MEWDRTRIPRFLRAYGLRAVGPLRAILNEGRWQAAVRRWHAGQRSLLLHDDHGVSVLLQDYERSYASLTLRRLDDAVPFAVMRRRLRKGDVVIDVGANIGFYSVVAARAVLPGGQVHAFEPVPAARKRLRDTLKVNECEQVTVIPKAVSDRVGCSVMYLFSTSPDSGWNSLGMVPRTGQGGTVFRPHSVLPVDTVSLDSYCQARHIDRIAFCKVDVEGFESEVFEGAAGLLRAGRIGLVCFEVCSESLAPRGRSAADVFLELSDLGYHIYRGGWDGRLRLFAVGRDRRVVRA